MDKKTVFILTFVLVLLLGMGIIIYSSYFFWGVSNIFNYLAVYVSIIIAIFASIKVLIEPKAP